MPAPEGRVFAHRYRIDRLLGQGGMGTVYDATDLQLDRRVALKVISAEHVNDEEQRRRFLREARASAALKSEHAVRVHEIGVEDGSPFLVMELLEGRTLEAILESDGAQPIARSVAWMLEALDAMTEAHARGFVHRDIKPANLFLAHRGGTGFVGASGASGALGPPIIKVLDFGLVKDVNPAAMTMTELTTTGTAMGTPAYMAPEQIRCSPDIDVRADVWSMGATLYELLTAKLPFEAPSVSALIVSVVRDEPIPIRKRRPEVSEALAGVVMRCLSKDPAARFASASDLSIALAAAAPTLDDDLIALGSAPTVDGGAKLRRGASATTQIDVARPPIPQAATQRTQQPPPTSGSASSPKPRTAAAKRRVDPRQRVSRVALFGLPALAVFLVGVFVMITLVFKNEPMAPVTPTSASSAAPSPSEASAAPTASAAQLASTTSGDASDDADSVEPNGNGNDFREDAAHISSAPTPTPKPAHRARVKAERRFDASRIDGWIAKLQRELTQCASPLPCENAKAIFYGDGALKKVDPMPTKRFFDEPRTCSIYSPTQCVDVAIRQQQKPPSICTTTDKSFCEEMVLEVFFE